MAIVTPVNRSPPHRRASLEIVARSTLKLLATMLCSAGDRADHHLRQRCHEQTSKPMSNVTPIIRRGTEVGKIER